MDGNYLRWIRKKSENSDLVIASPSTGPSTLLRAMSRVEWLRVNSSKPFGPELTAERLTAEGQSRNWPDIGEIATALRASQ